MQLICPLKSENYINVLSLKWAECYVSPNSHVESITCKMMVQEMGPLGSNCIMQAEQSQMG